MEGRPLSHLELLTIAIKDEQYIRQWVGDDVQELAQRLFGIRRWIQLRNAITVLSRFGYFALTSISNIRTPGEEFCEAHVMTSNPWKSLIMTALNNELQLPKEIPKSYAKLLRDVHLITFFLFGDFYQLSKRVTNYFYLTPDSTSYQSNRMSLLYRLIGGMSLVQLFLDLGKYIELQKEAKSDTEPDNKILELSAETRDDRIQTSDKSLTCHLCSERRIEPTSTVCGHIFCWTCIHKWLKERAECPICRTPTEPSRLIHLINFR